MDIEQHAAIIVMSALLRWAYEKSKHWQQKQAQGERLHTYCLHPTGLMHHKPDLGLEKGSP
jgi:hypothetical protein